MYRTDIYFNAGRRPEAAEAINAALAGLGQK
jgi:hypothetical protein